MNAQTMSKCADGTWEPAIPLPYFNGIFWWATKGRYECDCRAGFWFYSSYKRHYRDAHVERWECTLCGNREYREREVLCWKCDGRGEMIYRPAGWQPK